MVGQQTESRRTESRRTESRRTESRRTVLRGLGAGLGIPWLSSLQATAGGAVDQQLQPPVRVAFFYVPNGKFLPDWFPTHDGVLIDLPPSLKPLELVRDDLMTFSGLTHNNARSNGDNADCDHARGSATFLTGCQAISGRGTANVGISIDQLAAKFVGQETLLPSLELGLESGRQSGRSNSAYKANVSWSTPNTPAPYEVNPRSVFDRLFTSRMTKRDRRASSERNFYHKSILDYVADETKRVTRTAGKGDQRKLDQYLTAVREVERRIEKSDTKVSLADSRFARPSGIPDDFTDHVHLLTDLLVLAFQTDSTRIATMILAQEANNRAYPFLGFSDGHHDMSHHGGEEEKQIKLKQIDRYHVSLLARFVERLKTTSEGEGSLLDHSMIMYGSGISDGDRHDHSDLPIVVIGGGGGALRTGRHYQLRSETPACNLLLSMLHTMGMPLERFGDSTGPLTSIFA